MLTLIQEGGLPMWFILAFGMVTLGASVAYAIRMQERFLRLAVGMGWATGFSTVTGLALALGASFHALSGNRRPDISIEMPHGTQVMFQALAESMSPLIMGPAFLTLAAMFLAAGRFRQASSDQ